MPDRQVHCDDGSHKIDEIVCEVVLVPVGVSIGEGLSIVVQIDDLFNAFKSENC